MKTTFTRSPSVRCLAQASVMLRAVTTFRFIFVYRVRPFIVEFLAALLLFGVSVLLLPIMLAVF